MNVNRPLVACLMALALTSACGKKATGMAASGSGSAGDGTATGTAMTAEMPAGKDAATFAGKLVATTIRDWNPVDGGGDVSFTYTQMTFSESGSWAAKAELEASFESIPCTESGTWKIEEVESSASAVMSWTVDKTSCPTREAGSSQRVQMTLPKPDQYKIAFR